jgi:deazaflavin-dependent oxidoreductase (nitroreductase family)
MMKNYPPRGLQRLFLRTPLWFYRHGFGGMFAGRYLLIRHTGRRTGALREAVVEILKRDETTGRYWIASGWGEHPDWLKNISVTPQIEVLDGRKRFQAQATRLDEIEGTAMMTNFLQDFPKSLKMMYRAMFGVRFPADRLGCEQLARITPIVAIDPC